MTDLHYSDIELKASRMKNLGEDVINIQKSLSYYYYGGNKNKGQYSEEFEKMRNMVNSIVGDIGTFMTNYADAFANSYIQSQYSSIRESL